MEVVGQPGQGIQRMAQHITATTPADLLAVDLSHALDLIEILQIPTDQFRPHDQSRIPRVIGDQGEDVARER